MVVRGGNALGYRVVCLADAGLAVNGHLQRQGHEVPQMLTTEWLPYHEG